MKLKRDITTNAAPAPDQIEVGELQINSNTGIIYSKLTNGTIVKWVSSQLCDTTNGDFLSVVPNISFSDISTICCNGAAVTIVINNLIYGNRYRLTITDLNPEAEVVLSTNDIELLPVNSSQRSAIISIDIPSENKIAILKLSVHQIVTINSVDTNVLKSETILSTTCQNC